jgi:hypothetical protein
MTIIFFLSMNLIEKKFIQLKSKYFKRKKLAKKMEIKYNCGRTNEQKTNTQRDRVTDTPILPLSLSFNPLYPSPPFYFYYQHSSIDYSFSNLHD